MYQCINMSDISSAPEVIPSVYQSTYPHDKRRNNKERSKVRKQKSKARDARLRASVVEMKQHLASFKFEELHEQLRALDIRDSNGQHNDNAQLKSISNQVNTLAADMEILKSKFGVLDERCQKCCPS